jgi:hypothetical protein
MAVVLEMVTDISVSWCPHLQNADDEESVGWHMEKGYNSVFSRMAAPQ